VKLCTKNYENPSIFVKVTAKKSVAPFFLGHGVECCNLGPLLYTPNFTVIGARMWHQQRYGISEDKCL